MGAGNHRADVGANLGRIADAITPPCAPGEDETGGTVMSLTEAVMGITAALMAIASALTDVAEAIGERE